MSTISTHVLNTATGKPGAAMKIVFESVGANGKKTEIGRNLTNADGRVTALVPSGVTMKPGTYSLTFLTGEYFAASGGKCFYPQVEVLFEVGPADEHYHVPLLVSPFGFSTYRGS
jgi:5-hydroxyisourate hydrolase